MSRWVDPRCAASRGRANSRSMRRPTLEAFRALVWLSLGLVLWASLPHGHSEGHALHAGDPHGSLSQPGPDLGPVGENEHPAHLQPAVRREAASAGETVSADDHHREHSSQPLAESHPCSVCRSAEHHPGDRPASQGFAIAESRDQTIDRRGPDLCVRIFTARHPARGPPTRAHA